VRPTSRHPRANHDGSDGFQRYPLFYLPPNRGLRFSRNASKPS
jgi:hypothetical protein